MPFDFEKIANELLEPRSGPCSDRFYLADVDQLRAYTAAIAGECAKLCCIGAQSLQAWPDAANAAQSCADAIRERFGLKE